jgi:DsbC/DsbD-like thiol-disulfide interchange protein
MEDLAMRRRFAILTVLATAFWATMGSAVSAQPAEATGIVKARALSSATALEPGKTVRVGVLFDIAPEWHIYWKNPGESGYATEVKWTVPAGYSAGATLYPAPIVFESPGPLTSYGYAKQVLLMTDLAVPSDAQAGTEIELTADAKWLMCADRCIPGKDKLTLKLPVGPSQPREEALFAKYSALVPAQQTPEWLSGSAETSGSLVKVSVKVNPENMTLVGADKGDQQRKLAFFPYEQDDFNVSHPRVPAPDSKVGDIPVYTKPVTIEFVLDPFDPKKAAKPVVGGVLVYQEVDANGTLRDVRAVELMLPAAP